MLFGVISNAKMNFEELVLLQVIDLKTQVGYFKNASKLLRQNLGNTKARALLSRAVYLFSIGNNDYSYIFETNSSVLRSYSPEQFVALVIGNITEAIQVHLFSNIVQEQSK